MAREDLHEWLGLPCIQPLPPRRRRLLPLVLLERASYIDCK
jgi:hypothetical protein